MEETMSTPVFPGSITHRLGDWQFNLHNDGSITIGSATGAAHPQVNLGAEGVFYLALFFRQAGVRTLINRVELERQHERHVKETK
jgi:hypothetical protein